MTNKNILIVGGGLAGCFASYYLLKTGFRVTLVDDSSPTAASRVAAGLFNPITGKRKALTWKATELFEGLYGFFEAPENAALQPAFHPTGVYRPFASAFELNEWTGKSAQSDYASFARLRTESANWEGLDDRYGGLDLTRAGWVNCGLLLRLFMGYFIENKNFTLINTCLSYSGLLPESGRISGEGLDDEFDFVVFCEGATGAQNPWLPNSPLIPLKGQILEIELAGYNFPQAITAGCYLIPLKNERYILGATYEREFADPFPDEAGKQELLAALRQLLPKAEPKIIRHEAALRATTANREPILVRSKAFPRLVFINGLGVKGVTLAPWLAQKLPSMLSDN